jgi:RNA polymerase sigma factor for flagellar operon FliA
MDFNIQESYLGGVVAPTTQDKEEDHISAIRERMTIEHLPVVRSIVRRIQEHLPAHVSGEDLYGAGVIGLLDAVGKFDPSKSTSFRTYAQYRIQGAIMDSLRSLDWSPRRLRSRGRAVEQTIGKLTAQLQRSPDELEIARELKIALADYQKLLGDLKGLEVGTLHDSQREGSQTELVYVPSRAEDDQLFRVIADEMRELLRVAIERLPERERLLISLRYYEETTAKEISYILGVSEARVSQLHASALLHLRAGVNHAASKRAGSR